MIANGDSFYLRTANGYYVTAVNGGGSSVAASATYPGSNETFIWNRPNTY